MKSALITNLLFLILSSNCLAQQPYLGTIFIDPDIITSSDPSVIQSTTYTGQGTRTVFDRRTASFVTINAYLFDVIWEDGLTSEAQVNPEFGSVAAATIEAEKYAWLIGQLPYCLRVDVDAIWIHQGTEPFGGGNNSILIHTGQSTVYEGQGILEETLVHEACHTSLDAAHASAAGWIAAQNLDSTFISTYAFDNPTSEDIAESFLTWVAIRHRANRISQQDYDTIIQAIPNRIIYFDNQTFDMYPIVCDTITAANFVYNDLSLTVSFSDTTSGSKSWYWDFGDGNTDTIQNPTHTYSSSGNYYICLNSSNICSSDTICDSITVINTAIKETAINNRIKVFPNPYTEQTIVEVFGNYSDITLTVLNALGQKVSVINSSTNKITLKMDDLKSGLYFIQVSDKGKIMGTRKIVIEPVVIQ